MCANLERIDQRGQILLKEWGGEGADTEAPSLLSYTLIYVSLAELGKVFQVVLREPMHLCTCVNKKGGDLFSILRKRTIISCCHRGKRKKKRRRKEEKEEKKRRKRTYVGRFFFQSPEVGHKLGRQPEFVSTGDFTATAARARGSRRLDRTSARVFDSRRLRKTTIISCCHRGKRKKNSSVCRRGKVPGGHKLGRQPEFVADLWTLEKKSPHAGTYAI